MGSKWRGRSVVAAMVLAAGLAREAAAQVAAGLADPNVAAEKDLLALPHMNPARVKVLLGQRPFKDAVAFDTFLSGQSLTPERRREVYGKAFVHVNLNTAPPEEFLLIPGAGRRVAHEFAEYRPWKSYAQFDREIGKYVDAAEVARLKRYTFIPMDLNTASDALLQTIPGLGPKMLHELKEYRPYKGIAQFRREIGKYANEKEVARLERYLTLP